MSKARHVLYLLLYQGKWFSLVLDVVVPIVVVIALFIIIVVFHQFACLLRHVSEGHLVACYSRDDYPRCGYNYHPVSL